MKKFTVLSTKSIVCFALVGLLSLSGINKVVYTETKSTELSKTSNSSVQDEIKKSSFSTQELIKLSETALKNGKVAAEEINKIENEVDYEAALNYAMTAYYKNENFAQMAKFEESVDERSNGIIKGYKDAAKEREIGDDNGYETGTVLLTFDKDTNKKDIEAVVEAEYGKCRDIMECFNGDYVVTVDISLGQTVGMAKEAFKEYSITETASANDYDTVAATASLAVNDAKAYEQYYLDNMNVKAAWDLVSKSQHEKVLMGVIDSGIQLDHPDLDGVVSSKSIAITSDAGEYRLLSSLTSSFDTSHGTEVAGMIAAEANNGKYIAGVASCYNNDIVEILAVKVTRYNANSASYTMPVSYVIKAIDYCVKQGVKVINYSGSGATFNQTRHEMINAANDAGVIFVCSAGNTSSDAARYPSDSDNTISVVATTSTNSLASFSSYGLNKDFAAPGYKTVTTTTGSSSISKNGTSYSSPAVAAVIAMMCSVNNSLNFNSVYQILKDTCVDIGLGNKCKNGLVDAYAAVKAAIPAYVKEVTTEDVEIMNPMEFVTKNPISAVPLEVIGALVTTPSENVIAVVWGQDTERIENKYKYNVYVNDIKKLSMVDCNYYTLSDIDAGNATVKITALFNGVESAGVVYNVVVSGKEASVEETTLVTVIETTTAEETTTVAEIETTTVEPETTTKEYAVKNISKGKKAYASSAENEGLVADYVTDGNMSTRWSSAWTNQEWIYIDLGADKFVNYVELNWEAAHATTYQILTSSDGVFWTIVYNNFNCQGGIENISINQNARYVKLQGSKRATVYGYSLYEMSIFGY